MRNLEKVILNNNCVSLIPVEDVYRKKNINFIHVTMGLQFATDKANESGKIICKSL